MVESNQSALLAMHQRYEVATGEFDAIDCARSSLRDSDDDEAVSLRRQYDEGCSSSIGETDALRTAILFQVPQDATDAAILQYHIANAFDMMESCEVYPKHEQEALSTAISTLFDYTCRMACDAQQPAGVAFAYSVAWASRKRRYRTGQLEN